MVSCGLVAFKCRGSRMSSLLIHSLPLMGGCFLAAKRIPMLAIAGLDLSPIRCIFDQYPIFGLFGSLSLYQKKYRDDLCRSDMANWWSSSLRQLLWQRGNVGIYDLCKQVCCSDPDLFEVCH